ncbi:hypothetical protein GCM10027297_15140 [Parahaliea aestuarii]
MDARQFIAELKTRGVSRTAALYCAGAWALLQVADLVFPIIGLPDESVTLVLVAAAIGFLPAMLLAWWFDLTPQGVVSGVPQAGTARQPVAIPHVLELGLIVALVVSVGYLYIERLQENRSTAPSPAISAERPSIAVMPFINMSDSGDMAYLGDGVAEEVLNLLARLNELNVAARTSSFFFRDTKPDLKQVAESLGVGHILEGSVRREGEQVRVSAQLIDTATGFQVWSASYDRPVGGLLALQEDIAREVVDSLQVVLSDSSRRRLDQPADIDAAAYDFYLRGRDFLRRQADESNLDTAVALFQRALDISPEFAAAWAGVCDGLLGRYVQTLSGSDVQRADAACQRALSLDANAIPVYVAQGNLYRVSGRYDESLASFSRGLALAPATVEAYLGRGKTHAAMGDGEAAVADYEKAIELQPNYWRAYNELGTFYFTEGDYTSALPQLEKVAEYNPDSDTTFHNLGAMYYMLGRVEEASRAWARSVELAPSAETLSNLGSALFYSEDFAGAARRYREAIGLAPDNYRYWGYLGEALRFVPGQAQERNRAFQRAIELAGKVVNVNPNEPLPRAILASYQAQLGNERAALAFLKPLDEANDPQIGVLYYMAMARDLLGLHASALDALERAVELGYPPHLLAMDANFSNLRQEPRFISLLPEGKIETSKREIP